MHRNIKQNNVGHLRTAGVNADERYFLVQVSLLQTSAHMILPASHRIAGDIWQWRSVRKERGSIRFVKRMTVWTVSSHGRTALPAWSAASPTAAHYPVDTFRCITQELSNYPLTWLPVHTFTWHLFQTLPLVMKGDWLIAIALFLKNKRKTQNKTKIQKKPTIVKSCLLNFKIQDISD